MPYFDERSGVPIRSFAWQPEGARKAGLNGFFGHRGCQSFLIFEPPGRARKARCLDCGREWERIGSDEWREVMSVKEGSDG